MTAKPVCQCGGMNRTTGGFCGFLDHAAQEGELTCEIRFCKVKTPKAWLVKYAKRKQPVAKPKNRRK